MRLLSILLISTILYLCTMDYVLWASSELSVLTLVVMLENKHVHWIVTKALLYHICQVDKGVDYMSDHILQVHCKWHLYFFSIVLQALPQSSQILFVELLVFILFFLVRIVLWVFHPHTYYSRQPDMVIFLLWPLNDMCCIYTVSHQTIVEYWNMIGKGTSCLCMLLLISYKVFDYRQYL